jgi:hydroxyethylthiazole kinase-like uncharacterized protein yjeF
MHALLPADRDWPLHDSAATRRIEAAAQAALPAHTLMRRAGLAVARLALAVAPHARRVLVLAGPGNNGGDGFEAARLLHAAGREVQLVHFGAAARAPADAQDAITRAQAAGVAITPALPADPQAELLIDALFGVGATRAPDGAVADAIRRTAHLRHVLAVDLPTGLHPDTGALLGEVAVRATHTITLLTAKPGLFTAQGRDHAGRVWLDRLGISSDEAASALLAGAPAPPAPRRHAQHKGSFGDLLVVGGAPGMGGAALLAARAALAAGAGRVYLSALDTQSPLLDVGQPALMLRRAAWQERELPPTVVCGCGGGDAVRQALPPLLSRAQRLLLDADALNALAADAALECLLAARAARGAPTLLTPHPLEAARLLGLDGAAEVQADRLRHAQAIAERWRAVVVLKGSGTVIAAPGETPAINASGNARLASAGTGDVLAGWIGGLWAQAGDDISGRASALRGIATHGSAADALAGPVLDAERLLQHLRGR